VKGIVMGMVSQPLVVLPRPPRHRRRSNVSAQVADDVFVARPRSNDEDGVPDRDTEAEAEGE